MPKPSLHATIARTSLASQQVENANSPKEAPSRSKHDSYLPYLISFPITAIYINIDDNFKKTYQFVHASFSYYPLIFYINQMNFLSDAYDLVNKVIKLQSIALVNNILQAYFFSTAISHALCMLLKFINFAYA
jgi:hypothetical protein